MRALKMQSYESKLYSQSWQIFLKDLSTPYLWIKREKVFAGADNSP